MTATTAAQGLGRIAREGYGDGAWHGPDLKAALADVDERTAFWRPAADRHSIAEIAVHHAYYAGVVRGRLTGRPVEFFLPGGDWFELPANDLTWDQILKQVDAAQRELTEAIAAIESGSTTSPLAEAEQLDNVLGITCHAAYHAGQIQLLKRLAAGS